MTRAQISSFLSDFGYELNKDIQLPEVSSIYITTDELLYTSADTIYNFNTEDGDLLLIYNGKKNEYDEFIKNDEDTPNYIIPFSVIAGFNMASLRRVSEPYKFGRSA